MKRSNWTSLTLLSLFAFACNPAVQLGSRDAAGAAGVAAAENPGIGGQFEAGGPQGLGGSQGLGGAQVLSTATTAAGQTSSVGLCGNGNEDPGESCDDGNLANDDGCDASCRRENGWTCKSFATTTGGQQTLCQSRCGDGVKVGSEQCDDGAQNGIQQYGGCNLDCKLGPHCGDGIVQDDEQCDDGMNVGRTSGCGAGCRLAAFCGDGIVQSGEECDQGSANGKAQTVGAHYCDNNCRKARCGDGVLATNEGCDDGNSLSGDGCSSTCLVEANWVCPTSGMLCQQPPVGCGDGRVQSNEQCDDGNNTNNDGCALDCTVEPGWTCLAAITASVCQPVCGDGIVAGGEQCDDGVNDGGYGECGSGCTVGPNCGDGIVQTGEEQCDAGTANLPPSAAGYGDCTTACQLPTCGNGVIDPGEQCDLGAANGTSSCLINCKTVITTRLVCGDGRITGSEQCDDGNTSGGDGCSNLCLIEANYTCTRPGMPCAGLGPTTITSVCGNGVIEPGEECDDGNDSSTDSCSNACTKTTEML